MKDTLEYKEFIGTVHFNAEDEVFFGKIEEIEALVTFEGNTVAQLKKAFMAAVDDYIEICEEQDKPHHKSFRGSFNVRVDPELHRQAVRKSIKLGVSLNQLVQSALKKEVIEK